MINRATKLRWRRRFKRSKHQVEDMGVQAEEHFERNLVRRLGRLYGVRRFVAGWLLLLTLLAGLLVVQIRALSPYYQINVPAPGGIYTEGVVGAFTTANPLYASSGVDGAVSRLVFAGLLKYDHENKLVGDMADSWKLDKTEKIYTVRLKDGLLWHDGRPLTADDVVFTYTLIQNPDARSPLATSWRGVRVEALDAQTIRFTLPNVLSAFPYSMTNGIVPKHLLEDVEPSQLRTDQFNTLSPIGAGPFKWDAIEVFGRNPDDREERIGLVPNEDYQLGEPKLQSFAIRAFRNEESLLEAFKRREINAMAGLEALPEDLSKDENVFSYSVPITGAVMTFFNTENPVLSDVIVRRALVRAVDRVAVRENLGFPVTPVESPFLNNQFSFVRKLIQFGTNVDTANKLLDEAGWKAGADGIRQKGDQKLSFRLHAQDKNEFKAVAANLASQWKQIGVELQVEHPSDDDFKSALALHNYDALLYGISIGADPDVFAFWHSSQADPRASTQLNFSLYQSTEADTALEAGRTRADKRLRALKYQPFLKAWRNDAPALALYQPRFFYVTRGPLYNFSPKELNSAIDRYNNVHNWMIRQTKANRP